MSEMTRRKFLKRMGGVTVASLLALNLSTTSVRANEDEEQGGGSSYLECTADPIDNSQGIVLDWVHRFKRDAGGVSNQYVNVGHSKIRLKVHMRGIAGGPQLADIARKFRYFPTEAVIHMTCQQVTEATWDNDPEDWEWQTLVSQSGLIPMLGSIDLTEDQVEAWREIDPKTGVETIKLGQPRIVPFWCRWSMKEPISTVTVTVSGKFLVAARPELVFIGIHDMVIDRSGPTSIEFNLGLLDGSGGLGVTWGALDATSPPLMNLKFRWQKKAIMSKSGADCIP